ncbi:hypothetical protein KM043_007683 [Ampulex compressa]|nr:hypothetical protein KM043_007683 [Ampulex compressa]
MDLQLLAFDPPPGITISSSSNPPRRIQTRSELQSRPPLTKLALRGGLRSYPARIRRIRQDADFTRILALLLVSWHPRALGRLVVGLHRLKVRPCRRGGAVEALIVKVPKMADEAAPLGELAVAEDATELPPDAALEPDVAHEVALGDVGPGAPGALPLAVGIPDLSADRAPVAVQGEDVGVALAAAGAHVRLVGLGDPGGGVLEEGEPGVAGAAEARVEGTAVVAQVHAWQPWLHVDPIIRGVVWKKKSRAEIQAKPRALPGWVLGDDKAGWFSIPPVASVER